MIEKMFLAAGTMALAAAGILLGLLVTPDVEPRGLPAVRHPQPTATSVPAAPVRVDKVKLIIQQNVNCWWPVPGYVCTGREYL